MSAPPLPILERLLDAHATFGPAPLCPEVSIFQAKTVIGIWEAAEKLAEGRLEEAPFWATPWPAGLAIARFLLDHPERVRGRAVLDVGCGSGVASFAALRAGAGRVVACDKDPWALGVTRLAAERQGLPVEPWEGDLTVTRPSGRFDLVLAGDLFYERSSASPLEAELERLVRGGAELIAADAGRKYFSPRALEPVLTLDAPACAEIDDAPARKTTVYVRRPLA